MTSLASFREVSASGDVELRCRLPLVRSAGKEDKNDCPAASVENQGNILRLCTITSFPVRLGLTSNMLQ